MRSVAIIGNGNLGEALARAVSAADGIELRQVARRGDTPVEADLYIICVSDGAIAEVAVALPAGAAVVHTAGGVALSVLSRFARRGVLYPLQTFTKGRPVDFSTIPIFVEGATEEFTRELEAFAHRLSRTVRRADSDRRARLHLAAVFACNFVDHLYAVGAQFADFEVLKPLIAETAAKAIDSGDPARVQTGPAVRGDGATMQKHRQLLGEGRLREIYDLLSDDIWEISKKTLPR